ncbi:hypothetical protein PRELSG_0718600 [Plasmodium relictum]|uniref:Uncharacterized protein n=1 Tax=Plasmodium relictum TaxID=85471 RepID=A0A1J1H3F5_PLARL|nr:hypothetical protein PRELSG_0718600 [Plasmodium relictum]CRG99421.1 hypothetical protein PRELSG_0718600 [Plasmodium relictum]
MIFSVYCLLKLENAVEKKICEIENEMQNIFSFLNVNNKLYSSCLSYKKNSLTKKPAFYLNRYRKDKKKNNQRQKNLVIHSFLIKKKTQLKKEYANKKKLIKEEKNINKNLTIIQNRISSCIYNIYDEREIKVKCKKKKKCNHSVKLIREINLKNKNCVLSLAQSKDMNYLLAGLDNGTLYIYDFSKEDINNNHNKNVMTYSNFNKNYNDNFLLIHDGAIINIQFSNTNEKFFFTVGIDKKIKIWKINKNICFKDIEEVSKVNLKFVCEMKFNYHITNCIFHSNIKDTLIIGFINGIIKIVKLAKNYEEKFKSNIIEIEKKKNIYFNDYMNNPIINSNKSFFNYFTENSFNNSHNNNFFNNSNNNCCNNKKNVFRKSYNKNFFETNFLENMSNLKKKKKKIYELSVTKQIRTKFPICALAVSIYKNLLFVGMCNGIVNIYTNNYEFKKELICRSKKGIYSKGKQVSSIKFNENLNLIIVTTLDNRIRIFDKKKLFLIYKLKGYNNCSLSFESKIFVSVINSRKNNNKNYDIYKKIYNKNYKAYEQIYNKEKKKKYYKVNSSFLRFNTINTNKNIENNDLVDFTKSNNFKKNFKIISPSDSGKIYMWNFSLSLEKDNTIPTLGSQYIYSKNSMNFFCHNLKKKNSRQQYFMHNKDISVRTNNSKEKFANNIQIRSNHLQEYMQNHTSSNIHFSSTQAILKKKKSINKNNFFQKIKKNFFKKSSSLNSKKKEQINFNNIIKFHKYTNGEGYHFSISKLIDKHKRKKKKKIKSLNNLDYFISHENKKISASYISNEFFYIQNNSNEKKSLYEKRVDNSKINFLQKIKNTLKNKKKNNTNKYSLFKKYEHSFHDNISCCKTSCSKNMSFQKNNNENSISKDMHLQKHFLIITANGNCIKIFMCYEKS